MSEANSIESFIYFLAAAVFSVPIFQRFKLGAILGYLAAGILIGPQVFNLIHDPVSILHFAEIGVVLLLFIIGLDIEPQRLWNMRRQICLLGGGQLIFTTLLLGLIIFLFQPNSTFSIVIGLSLALSSTAFAIQLMAERSMIASTLGRHGLAILLLQDLAVIPILLLVQSFSQVTILQSPPWWIGILAIAILLAAGRYLLDPLLSTVARYGNKESMTATALLIVVGAAYGMQSAGLSMGLGAFVAGLLLANSNFRHQLETDIEPFKGLTLGLFFIAIGMSLDLQLFWHEPWFLLAMAVTLVVVKTLVIGLLLRWQSINWKKGIQLGLFLSQGGEFAFVIMAQSVSLEILPTTVAAKINLVVGLSMMLTTPLISLFDKIFANDQENSQTYQPFSVDKTVEVMILGFGRFGQITGRILAANKIKFTALDQDAEHISFLMQFGNKVHFGDATRLDLLIAAGIENVTTIVLAIDDPKQTVELVKLIKTHFPEKTLIARARNRTHHMELVSAGADKVIREIMDASLQAASETLHSIGYTTSQVLRTVELFRCHDEKMISQSLEHRDNLDKLIEIGRQGRKELENLFSRDKSG